MGKKRANRKGSQDDDWEEGASVMSDSTTASQMFDKDPEVEKADEWTEALDWTYESRGSTRERGWERLSGLLRNSVREVREQKARGLSSAVSCLAAAVLRAWRRKQSSGGGSCQGLARVQRQLCGRAGRVTAAFAEANAATCVHACKAPAHPCPVLSPTPAPPNRSAGRTPPPSSGAARPPLKRAAWRRAPAPPP